MPGTTVPLSPHHTVFATETPAVSQCVTTSMGQSARVAGQMDAQHSQPDSENTLTAICPSFILLAFTLFVLASSCLGQTLAFAICFCASRSTLILIIYDSRANIVQIASPDPFFVSDFKCSFLNLEKSVSTLTQT